METIESNFFPALKASYPLQIIFRQTDFLGFISFKLDACKFMLYETVHGHANQRSSGLVINSYLSMVLRIRKSSDCFAAVLEVFRIGGMLTSDLHLFALAINQFVGIAWPLKYKVTFFYPLCSL